LTEDRCCTNRATLTAVGKVGMRGGTGQGGGGRGCARTEPGFRVAAKSEIDSAKFSSGSLEHYCD
jgi:hypothetical protein